MIYAWIMQESQMCFVFLKTIVICPGYLQLSTNAFAESSSCSDTSSVLGSVTLKKCFTRPIKVCWSQRGMSMLNVVTLAAILLQSRKGIRRSVHELHGLPK